LDAQSAEPAARQPKLRPPQIVAEALTTPEKGALAGTPVSLLSALSRTTDRQQQLAIARAYWKLATAQAEYRWALDQHDRLRSYVEAQTGVPEALSALASARAEVRDAELVAVQAQQELVDLIGQPSGEGPPLAVDRPHVGGYNTYFDEIFTQRTPPPRIRLINRMLPIRRKAIDAHGEAILAALDALAATGEDFSRSGQGLVGLLTALEQLKQERRLFLAVVRDYNWEIAEYLFAVAPLGTTEQVLVSKLILVSEQAAQPPATRTDDRTFAPENNQPAGTPANTDGQPREPRRISAYQPAADAAESVATESDAPAYGALKNLDPAERVVKLAALLHWERALPRDAGQPTALRDCLRQVSANGRKGVIAAYWQARERVACYQALSEQSDQLNSLAPVLIAAREEPGMAQAGVRLHAVRRAASAAVVDAEARLLDAEFSLTQAAGGRLDAPWLRPATPPQTRYMVAANTGAAQEATRSSTLIEVRRARLEDLADAVIEADASRAGLAGQMRQAPVTGSVAILDQAIWAVGKQTHDTLAFLAGLTGYNVAIADDALAHASPTSSNDELILRLIPAGETRDKS
jgi:hypothetical protein